MPGNSSMKVTREMQNESMRRANVTGGICSVAITLIFLVHTIYKIFRVPTAIGAGLWFMYLPLYAGVIAALSFGLGWSCSILYFLFRNLASSGWSNTGLLVRT